MLPYNRCMTSPEKPSSRNIPLPVQREIRQRCGFGCVMCGLPLYEYDHLLGWENVHRHVAEEITLLCDMHHREKTSGMLPIEKVLEGNKSPYNLRNGVSKPYDLHYEGKECEVVIGSNIFRTTDQGYGTVMIPVSIDDVASIGFVLTEGHLLLNLNLYDEANNLVLRIVNNQLYYSASPWDIQFVGRNLIVRDAPHKILVDIEFEIPNKIVIQRGRFLRNGVEVLIKSEYILLTNTKALFQGNEVINCSAGIVIGPHLRPLSCAIRIPSVNRYLADRSDAIRWAEESFR